MKQYVLAAFLIISHLTFGQSYVNESKMIEFLGQDRYQSLLQDNPGYLKFIDARYSFGFAITDYVAEKMNMFPVLEVMTKRNLDKSTSEVTIETFLSEVAAGTVNYLMYVLPGDQKTHKHYVLGNSGKVIIVYSTDYVNGRLN